MINTLFFSIAGKKRHDDIDDILAGLMQAEYIPKNDKITISYAQEVATKGNYPSEEYFESYYETSNKIKALAEIKVYVDLMRDFYAKEHIISNTMRAINESSDKQDLIERISGLLSLSDYKEDDNMDEYRAKGYSDMNERPENAGFYFGISDVDKCTNGGQPGTIGTVAAFTSEGKSTLWVSAIYKNVKQGKKGALFSLEVHPDIVWMQLFSRFLYEEKSLEITASELVQRTLTDEKKKLVESHEEEFFQMLRENLVVLDEGVLNKSMMSDPKAVKRLYKRIEKELGGLEFVVFDHVNQFELMFEGLGNTAIRTLQSAGKTYHNQNGVSLFTGFACQTNRDGWKRARKRQGVYDLTAISDLNEVERSSTYVVFMYTSEDMRMIQETKVTMAKNRLGSLMVEPVTTTFNPQVMVVGDLMETVSHNDNFGQLTGSGFGDFEEF